MQVIKNAVEVIKKVNTLKNRGKTVGFVPTMGDLHEGHLSLVRASVEENDITVLSNYVNPKQFAPHEDFDSYPRDLERDNKLCKELGVDMVFAPTTEEMYPEGWDIDIPEFPYFIKPCDGTRDPGYMPGIARAVYRLFELIPAHRSYFGQKDYQQTLLVKWLTKTFHIDMKIIVCPIVRERDGLAISSRNRYLNEEQRKKAPVLFQALSKIKNLVEGGETDREKLEQILKKTIESKTPVVRFSYGEIRERGSMNEIDKVELGKNVGLCAAYAGKARLIDNMLL